MDYLVLARKYRPQTFAEVAGQGVIAKTLANALVSGRVAHAYLFTGPRGVGKTSTARILAKALCCEQGPTPTPCGVCAHCKMITDGGHPDVAEIDAARYNSVDHIRELSDGAVFAPSMARSKVYILDEVHMLSASAWNALLKLLEEPPAHVRFIFATTEVDKVLPTVLSRCQRFDFRAIELDDIVKRLQEVAEAEGATLSATILARIARAAGGGMRDAQTLLDQLIAVSDGEVKEEDLNMLLGAARGEDLLDLYDHLLAGKPGDAIVSVDSIIAGGVSPGTFLEQSVDHLRLLLLIQACGAESAPVRRLGGATPRATKQAKDTPPEKLLRMAQILAAAQQAIKHGVDPRLQLELVCVRLGHLGAVQDFDGLLRRLERLEGATAASGGAAARPR